jgi:hypothetical protein
MWRCDELAGENIRVASGKSGAPGCKKNKGVDFDKGQSMSYRSAAATRSRLAPLSAQALISLERTIIPLVLMVRLCRH